jgi:hypothetical protein
MPFPNVRKFGYIDLTQKDYASPALALSKMCVKADWWVDL